MRHSLDHEHGGYFTCLDRDGSVLDKTKFHWLQGRQVWTLSRMYNSFAVGVAGVSEETRESWFAAAAAGARFLKKAMRDDGMLWFSTTQSGDEGVHFQRRPFTAVFYILGSLEYYQLLRTRKAEGKDVHAGSQPRPLVTSDAALEAEAAAYAEQALVMFAKFRAWVDDATLLGRPAPPKGSDAYSNLGEARRACLRLRDSGALAPAL